MLRSRMVTPSMISFGGRGGGERRGKMIGCGSSGAFEKRMHEERENVIRLIEQARGSMLSGHERSMKFGLDARKKN